MAAFLGQTELETLMRQPETTASPFLLGKAGGLTCHLVKWELSSSFAPQRSAPCGILLARVSIQMCSWIGSVVSDA